ncbi:MAG: DUF3179 domain-containing (seleno)protein [Persicimonas sp.]
MNRLITLIALAAAVVATVAGCRSTDTEFKQGADGGSGHVGSDADDDPVTIGGTDAGQPQDASDASVEGDAVHEDADEYGQPDGGSWVPAQGSFVLQDQQTGTYWNLRGEAFRGPLAGHKLEQVPAFNSFWFAWSVFYDGSEIWNQDIDNSPGTIDPDDNCLVPCDEIRLGCGGGKDCIPALESAGTTAQMVAADHPEAEYLQDSDFVLATTIGGSARAYPHNILWWHEIYNDTVDGEDYSVTFCPLTGSGIVFEGRAEQDPTFGVSGKLYNSNLVMYDRETDSNWSQMLGTAVTGPQMGSDAKRLPIVETTWGRWKQMHPDTLVISENTGHSRDYSRYPYGDYRTNHDDTFRATNPDYQDTYRAKDRVLGLVGEQESRVYAFPEIEEFGTRVVINDTFEGDKLVIAYEAAHRMAVPFYARADGRELTFEGVRAP